MNHMPESHRDEPVDQVAFYEANKRKFLGVMIGFSGMGSLGMIVLYYPNWYSHWQAWNVFGMFGCMAAAWIWSDKRVQYCALIIAVLLSANYAIYGIAPIAGGAEAG